MKKTEFVKKSEQIFYSAFVLVSNGCYDEGVYLGGYSLEFLFKAVICSNVGIDNLFSDDLSNYLGNNDDTKTLKDFSKECQIHNLSGLMIRACLYKTFEQDKLNDRQLAKSWAFIVELNKQKFSRTPKKEHQSWSEQIRYYPARFYTQNEATEFIESVKYIMQWIKQYLK